MQNHASRKASDAKATVISHLSIGEHALEEEAFQRTMKYIFNFVEKVRISSTMLATSAKTQTRKNKRMPSLRNCANDSGSALSLVNGVISHIAYPYCRSSQSDR